MLRILHLEDREEDALLVQAAFKSNRLNASFQHVQNRPEFFQALELGGFDMILADSSLPGMDGTEALKMARDKYPNVSILALSGALNRDRAQKALQAGADHYVSKDDLWQLIATVRAEEEKLRLQKSNRAMVRLVKAVQDLSLARDLESIMAVVRQAARELAGSDGATFILRDGDLCHYADEDAISPLWKGQRFPMPACISGWAMLNRQPVIIEDIYSDPRIPFSAYRPTFVKSLVMVPIRTEAPIGAIGNYWAHQRMPAEEEVQMLQALANTTAVAMENVQVHGELEKRVKNRTSELEAAYRELESFSYAVSHDLKAPLRAILGFTEILQQDSAAQLDAKARGHLERITASGQEMSKRIADLLKLAQYARAPLFRGKVNLSQMAGEIIAGLTASSPERKVSIHIADGLEADGDAGLLKSALENLLANAWKYSSKNPEARIEFNAQPQADGSLAYYIRDNGVGFNMEYTQKLFQPFQRLHSDQEFPGTGVGLATVQRIIQRHGGRIWTEGEEGKGATFYFVLQPDEPSVPPTQNRDSADGQSTEQRSSA